MSRTRSRLPLMLAAIGVAVPFALEAMWRYVDAHTQGAEPYDALLALTLTLFPGDVLGFAVEDFRGWLGPLVATVVGVASNGVLYYWVGRGIVVLSARWRRKG